jgi:chromosome segregation ATPase
VVSQEGLLKEQHAARQAQLAENAEVSAAVKRKDEEVTHERQEAQRQLKKKEQEIKKLKLSEDAALDLESLHSNLLGQADQLQREIEIEKKEHAAESRNAAEVRREIEEIDRGIGSTNDLTQRQVDIVRLNATMIKQLEGEINLYKSESMKQRKIVHHLEKERERFGAEASDAGAKFVAALEEVKLREMTILDLQKKIAEGDARLKQQQNLYEAVRSDRNLYSKSLIESQDEIAEMKRKFKIMNHQIEQLKEEIDAKDQAFVKEHIEHSKADKEKDVLKNDLMRVKKGVASAETTIKNFEAEVGKLNHIISEADAERFRQKREYDVVINERDILGTQLIRRNDELALLAEKLKVQSQTISTGEIEYRERLEDVRVLKLRSNAMRRDLSIHSSQSSNLEGLRAEVYSLQRELLQDRTKVKALSEELENPNNAHRWRKLEGSDPGTYEMLQKIQALQKRLISKTEEVVEKDLMIQEKDKLYVELKNILARQPGPEVAEQLSVFQQGLRDRTKSMKAMASELNMYQAQINESKYEMERVTRELQDVKRKYYEQKRRETLSKEREALRSQEQEQLTMQSM